MNVFKIHYNYRYLGINYGLPVFYIDLSFGSSTKIEKVGEILASKGLNKGSWVVIRGRTEEQGLVTLIKLLKTIGCRVEFETSTESKTPAWFPEVDRWIVWWEGDKAFNIGGLRARQDMLLIKEEDIEEVLPKNYLTGFLKGVVVEDRQSYLEAFRSYDIRVYLKEEVESVI